MSSDPEDIQEIQDPLQRIEAKLDYLIMALAEDDEDEEPTDDLEGNVAGGPRDETEEL